MNSTTTQSSICKNSDPFTTIYRAIHKYTLCHSPAPDTDFGMVLRSDMISADRSPSSDGDRFLQHHDLSLLHMSVSTIMAIHLDVHLLYTTLGICIKRPSLYTEHAKAIATMMSLITTSSNIFENTKPINNNMIVCMESNFSIYESLFKFYDSNHHIQWGEYQHNIVIDKFRNISLKNSMDYLESTLKNTILTYAFTFLTSWNVYQHMIVFDKILHLLFKNPMDCPRRILKSTILTQSLPLSM